jgi:alpha-D-xyloside xylohydrolase
MVAPVLSADGGVDYYVPAGKWTNFLTGKVVAGPSWVHETHGFLSAPLMVRPNSVIAVGVEDSRPDYDFEQGVTLRVYRLEDGQEATATVPNLKGDPALKVRVTRTGATIVADVQGVGSWRLLLVGVHRVLSTEGGTASPTDLGVVIEPIQASVRITVG